MSGRGETECRLHISHFSEKSEIFAGCAVPLTDLSTHPGVQCRGDYRIRGNCSHWWKGGGEESCHSSVVAPSPHGLAPASRFFAKASKTL